MAVGCPSIAGQQPRFRVNPFPPFPRTMGKQDYSIAGADAPGRALIGFGDDSRADPCFVLTSTARQNIKVAF